MATQQDAQDITFPQVLYTAMLGPQVSIKQGSQLEACILWQRSLCGL